jgi:hypothetical protein
MNHISRATFIRSGMAGAALLPGIGFGAVERNNLRSERVGWARLKTASQSWMRHANGDPGLMRFIREHTSLNIDPTWQVADVENLDEMRQYPLLFSQGIHVLQTAASKSNVVEYIHRGGFLLVDACCNPGATPSEEEFLAQHIQLLGGILPKAKVVLLPPEHPVYRCFFNIPDHHPPHTFYGHVYNARKAKHGLHGIMIGNRMAGLISLSGMQCGWSPMGTLPPPGHREDCMKMLVNIYVYAMMQGKEAAQPGAATPVRRAVPVFSNNNSRLPPPSTSQ